MARALITDARGFTGWHLLKELLNAGHEVCDLAHTLAPKASVRMHVCGLLDRTTLTEVFIREQPEAVVCLVAITFVAHGDVRAIYETDMVGTRNLLDAIHTSGCRPKSVLLAGSTNIYGNADREVIGESTPAAPANDYMASKPVIGYMARLWEDKLPIIIVGSFSYIGVGQPPNFLLPRIVSHLRERKPVLELGNLYVVRDFSGVHSVVTAYGHLFDERFADQTFNVYSDTGYMLKDVLAMMSDFAGYQPEAKVNVAFVHVSKVHTLIGSSAELREAIGAQPTIALRDTPQWIPEAGG